MFSLIRTKSCYSYINLYSNAIFLLNYSSYISVFIYLVNSNLFIKIKSNLHFLFYIYCIKFYNSWVSYAIR